MCRFIVSTKEILSCFNNAKSYLKKNVKICVVVKANAYGFGLPKICSLLSHNADYFAVSSLCEYMKVREFSDKPCLILTPLIEKEASLAIKNGAEITIDQSTNLVLLDKLAKKDNLIAKVHIKLDTGMNRYGAKTETELKTILDNICMLSNIKLVGCYSHFSSGESKVVERQRARFQALKEIVLSYGFSPIFHIASSFSYKDGKNQEDMVRLGYEIYAGKRDSEHKLTANIVQIKNAFKGENVGYLAYRAKKNMLIAVINAGYGDGLPRRLQNGGKVLVKGKKAKILAICMDSTIIDISNVPTAKLGEEVVIFGKYEDKCISICSLAKECDTIPYEILTNISSRVKRIYRWKKSASNSREIQEQKTS